MKMEFPQTEHIQLSREGAILIVALHNPPHNYLPIGFFRELFMCLALMSSDDIRAVIITGQGKVFSKGADISEIRTKSKHINRDSIVSANNVYSQISRLKKPVVAAINGHCLGGGLELALACHMRLCSEKAWLGLPEVTAGVIPGLGGIQRLIGVVGEAKALEMILLGDIISASRALELKLVNRVLPKEQFMSNVLLFVKTLLDAPQNVIADVLRLALDLRSKQEESNILQAAERFVHLIQS